MKTFITDNFLLQNNYAQKLFHDYAKLLSIIDYHNHLIPEELAKNKQFSNITQVWLYGDHYKWRAMRTLGIEEKYITGGGSDKKKFEKWAECVPYTMRNPLYHWTHLELLRYFNIDSLLDSKSSDDIYSETNHLLALNEYSAMGLLQQMNVESVCTTDDPTDSLTAHQELGKAKSNIKVLPTFRPDKAYNLSNVEQYKSYIKKLESACGLTIEDYDSLLSALLNRIEFFHQNGCRLSDHGLESLVFVENNHLNEGKIFSKALEGEQVNPEEGEFFRFKLLTFLCRAYCDHGWVQQFHLGGLRNTNHRMLSKLGPDTGFDSIGDFSQAEMMARFFDHLESTNQLAKTIVYNLNPADNEVFATMTGNFNGGSIKGKVQFGSAWWFLDQKDGIEKQLNTLSNLGLLSCFVGMLTDSRSLLSFPRHEYFRRILCNLIGEDVKNGLLPWDEKWLGKLVGDICYYNAKNYFDF
ncbi:glucuronate isomerase [Winogradskyella sp.]|uniref:glucuronate isomerase n=1 Tax=Winogradskyella sp. TaxID=1883156 RepID=UPI002632B2A5|nr:glucuronate isomerase [Winogradskyella sp.]